MYKVYMHENKINHKKYIGITCQKLNKRWQNGFGYIKNNQDKFERAIKKYGWNNFEHFVLCDDITEEYAKELEKYFISKFDTYKNGYNGTIGGDGISSYKHSDKTKELMMNKKAYKMKPVKQYDLNMNFIKTYYSMMYAERETNVSVSHIIKVCKGERKTAGGFIWRYA